MPTGAFTASFVYQESTGYTYPMDGVTFVLQNSSSGVMALGGSGADLGYAGTTGFTAVTPSAGIGLNPYFQYYNSQQLLWLSGGGTVGWRSPLARSRTLATRSRSRSATTART